MLVWEFLRDIGLCAFIVGGLMFVASRNLPRYFGRADVAWLATLGDAAMFVGACLAVAAMIIGYVAAGESPSWPPS